MPENTHKIKETRGNHGINGCSFRPCITDGTWAVAPFEITDTTTNQKAIFFFGTDMVKLTIYNRNNPEYPLEELAIDTAIQHIEKDAEHFTAGVFRFEFDGSQFNLCEEEPKWASYDCGVWE